MRKIILETCYRYSKQQKIEINMYTLVCLSLHQNGSSASINNFKNTLENEGHEL